MLNKFKGKTAPTPKKNVKLSDHILRISKDYTEDKTIQSDTVDAYLEMRPKSYGEVFHQLFKGSKQTSKFFHLLSSILCFPLMFSLIWTYVLRNDKESLKALIDAVFVDVGNIVSLPFLIAFSISLTIVLLAEYWQHIALVSSCKIYYQNKQKVHTGLFLLAAVFSVWSVVSFGYGAFEVVEVQSNVDQNELNRLDVQIADAMRSRKATNSKNSELLLSKDRELEYLRGQRAAVISATTQDVQKYSYILVFASLLIEIMIIYTTVSMYQYKYKTMQSLKLHNDLFKGANYLGLDFANVTPTLPDNYNAKSTDRINQESNKPHRAKTDNQSVNVFDLIKGKNAVNSSTGSAAVLIDTELENDGGAKVYQSAVHTENSNDLDTNKKSTKKDVGNIDKSRLEWYQRSYQKKVKTAKRSDSLKRRTNRLNYINHKLSTFKQNQQDGKVYFDLNNADKFAQHNQS